MSRLSLVILLLQRVECNWYHLGINIFPLYKKEVAEPKDNPKSYYLREHNFLFDFSPNEEPNFHIVHFFV
jgi:hypothetical protein